MLLDINFFFFNQIIFMVFLSHISSAILYGLLSTYKKNGRFVNSVQVNRLSAFLDAATQLSIFLEVDKFELKFTL